LTTKRRVDSILRETLRPVGFNVDPKAAERIRTEIDKFVNEGKFENDTQRTEMTQLLGLKAAYVAHERGHSTVKTKDVNDMIYRIPCPYPFCSQSTLLHNSEVSAVVLKPTKDVDHEVFKRNVARKYSRLGIKGVDDLADSEAVEISRKLKVDDVSAHLLVRQAKVITRKDLG